MRAPLRWVIQPWDLSKSCAVAERSFPPRFPTMARRSCASARVAGTESYEAATRAEKHGLQYFVGVLFVGASSLDDVR